MGFDSPSDPCLPISVACCHLTLIIPGGLSVGPGGKNQSALSFSVEAWPPDEVQEHIFPNSEIEIFVDFRQISQILKKFSGDEFKS